MKHCRPTFRSPVNQDTKFSPYGGCIICKDLAEAVLMYAHIKKKYWFIVHCLINVELKGS